MFELRSHRAWTWVSLIFLSCLHSIGAAAQTAPHRREDCGTDPRWASTVWAWEEADTDQNLHQWWTDTIQSNSQAKFANQLGRQFGSHVVEFSCAINNEGTCVVLGCQDYVDAGDQPWTFEALSAVVNLDTFLNRLWQGIGSGQSDFGDLAGTIAQTFFPWHDPTVGLTEAAFWIDATIGALFNFIEPEVRLGSMAVNAIREFANARSQEVELQLIPSPDLTVNQGTALISEAVAQSAQKSRAVIEQWTSNLFSGSKDALGNTILNYLRGGSFIVSSGPPNTAFENFWKTSMISRVINSQWKTRPNFVTFARTANRSTDVGPEASKYYSAAQGGVYYLYQWKNGGLEVPDGMWSLQDASYKIQPWEVTESSARAFEVAGFNYTPRIALDQLKASLLNSTTNPVLDGAHWTGLWTLAVCDMGDFIEWNGQYGNSRMAPC